MGCFSFLLIRCNDVLPVAVQCERKPVEVTAREKTLNCAASTEKIYIRKNLCSPLAATPTFVTDKETVRYSRFLGLKRATCVEFILSLHEHLYDVIHTVKC